jgi:N,N'-diacetyllegionaminate synthase
MSVSCWIRHLRNLRNLWTSYSRDECRASLGDAKCEGAFLKFESHVAVDKAVVGPGRPCLVIAEAGVNHNGSPELAAKLVDAACAAKADAVKFQTFVPEAVVSPYAPKAEYQKQATGSGESQLEMVRKLALSREAHRDLAAHCRRRDILFLSTPFDAESADFLDTLEVPAFKLPSGEVTNLPFLQHVARKGKPLLLSTGMATLDEVKAAVATIGDAGNFRLVLLHCVSNYPALASEANLSAMKTMAQAFGVPVGYSDHVMGNDVALAAVAMGACVIEKHFTLDRSLPGPDHQASATPDELAALVRSIRAVESAVGDGRKQPALRERETAAVARRSLVAARDLMAGTVLDEAAIAILRPGTGLAPALLPQILGRRLARSVPAGALLGLEMLE